MEQQHENEEERLVLLANFVTVVESILTSNPLRLSHVSGVYDRTHDSILPILLHGIQSSQKHDQLWEFVLGLRVIKPNLWPTELFKPPDQEPASLISLWLKQSFKAQRLSLQIEALVSDSETLEIYYNKEAFLRSENFVTSLITALHAFDQNSQHILAKIDHKLMAQFVLKKSLSADIQYDMSDSSPITESGLITASSPKEADIFSTCGVSHQEMSPIDFKACYDEIFSDAEITDCDNSSRRHSGTKSVDKENLTPAVVIPVSNYPYSRDLLDEDCCYPTSERGFNTLYDTITENWLLKPPAFILKHLTKSSRVPVNLEKYRIKVNNNMAQKEELSSHKENKERDNRNKFTRPSRVRSYSDGSKFIERLAEPLPYSPVSKSIPYSSDLVLRTKISKRFMEDGGHSIEACSYGFFPRPRPGQHLFDFLNDCYRATTNAQLDRENAHFSIADAVIGAIETMNYDAETKDSFNTKSASDDSENDMLTDLRLKQHRQKRTLRKKSQYQIVPTGVPVTDGHRQSSSDSSDDLSGLSDDTVLEEELVKSSDESLSEHSASAETVAISLLRNYNSKLLPKAIDLQWRFPEEEELIKKPEATRGSTTLEDSFDTVGGTSIRGTADWAPPRPQLVLVVHRKPNKISIISAQKWRCAGCGLKVCHKMSRHFRFCTYLGKYFCTSCHTNKKSVIPASVIFNWDFSQYSVSNFSSELLLSMQSDPLFNVTSLNVSLYKQCQCLNQCHIYRLQLYNARKYVVTCRNAVKENELLESVPLHWSTEPHVYSIDDLLAVKLNQFLDHMSNLTSVLIKHISFCEVCLGRGFVCELCKKGKPIFPFQLDAVTECKTCKACYHVQCFLPDASCLRCARRVRKQQEKIKKCDVLPLS